MILARDIMTRDPICISAENDVAEVVQFFLKNHVSSAPVVGGDGLVLGQLSELDLIRAVVKRQLDDPGLKKIGQFQDYFTQPEFVTSFADLATVVKALIRSPLHRALVADSTDRLLGIISPKDVLRALGGGGPRRRHLTQDLQALEDKVKELNKTLQAQNKDLSRYAQVFDSEVYMMHSADRTGKILLANQALHQALDYGDGELIGKSVFDIYPLRLHETVKAGLERVIAGTGLVQVVSSFLTKNGDEVRVEIASSALRDENGNVMGTFTISHLMDTEHLLRKLHGVLGTSKLPSSS